MNKAKAELMLKELKKSRRRAKIEYHISMGLALLCFIVSSIQDREMVAIWWLIVALIMVVLGVSDRYSVNMINKDIEQLEDIIEGEKE